MKIQKGINYETVGGKKVKIYEIFDDIVIGAIEYDGGWKSCEWSPQGISYSLKLQNLQVAMEEIILYANIGFAFSNIPNREFKAYIISNNELYADEALAKSCASSDHIAQAKIIFEVPK